MVAALQIEQALTEKSFNELFKLHFSPLTYFALKFVRDTDIAKEIVHDVFIKMWDKREQIDSSRPVKSYLYTSVNNRCLNHIRDNKKFVSVDQENEHLLNDEATIQVDDMETGELKEKIDRVIAALPEKCREIFMMSRFGEMKYAEIAEELNLSVKTVEAQMSKALKFMRIHLKDYITIVLFTIIKLFDELMK